jgi:pyridoxal phosphate enzyme (YggS family)
MSQIAQHLLQVKERIVEAARRVGRSPDHIQLLAVSKTKPLGDIQAAYAAGQRRFGESYAQEAALKIDALREQNACTDIEWHFIGPLQSNKSKLVAERLTGFKVSIATSSSNASTTRDRVGSRR